MKSQHPTFLKSLCGSLFAIALGFMVLTRSSKSKFSFQNVRGILMSFDSSNKSFQNKESSKFRYLRLDNFSKTFQLFIGKGSGDFKPEFEKIDALKIGDSVTIYFDENFKTKEDSINRLTYFIDKGNEAFFIKGGFEKYVAYFIIGIAIIFILTLIILKKKGKII